MDTEHDIGGLVRRPVMAALILFTCTSLRAAPRDQAEPSPTSAAVQLSDGKALLEAGDLTGATARLTQAAEVARAEGMPSVEIDALILIGSAMIRSHRNADARAALDRALAMSMELKDPRRIATAHDKLGTAWFYEDRKTALQHYVQSVQAWQDAQDPKEEAGAITNVVLVCDDSDIERWIVRGLELARAANDSLDEARLLHARADVLRSNGDFAGASEALETALRLVEPLDQGNPACDIMVSLGHLYRTHGDTERSIEWHKRALERSEKYKLLHGGIWAHNGIAMALTDAGRTHEAAEQYEEALALAREMGGRRLILSQLGNVADAYLQMGAYSRAYKVLSEAVSLEEAEESSPGVRALRHLQMAIAQLGLGHPSLALTYVDKALDVEGDEEVAVDARVTALYTRARALAAMGQAQSALANARQGIEVIESLRLKLIPQDFLKQEFAQRSVDAELFGLTIDLLLRVGRPSEALEMAERARGRAFLDLLAQGHSAAGPSSRSVTGGPASMASVSSADFGAIAATAARLHSTVVSYFVGTESSFAWTVSPSGKLSSYRLPVGRKRLQALVDSIRRTDGHSGRGYTMRTRGGTVLWPQSHGQTAWRDLYDELVAPLRASLPRPGSRVTVVPHGPLALVPFAALRDPLGRYMIEDFAIHYAPAVGFFNRARPTSTRDVGTLVVADPSPLPVIDGRDPLIPLPGSLREANEISVLRPGATVLSGRRATKDALQNSVGDKAIVHLATHSIAESNDPFGSFLALATSPSSDGRLTAAQVYDMSIDTNLVVLSGCQTASGRPSADGVLGLTRAFLAAGASSVVSTTWDVLDDPSMELMRTFYQALNHHLSPAEALQRAQLTMIHRLRSGELTVAGPLGRVAIPEDPVVWAGFMEFGQP